MSSESRLMTALKRRYRTPSEVLTRLGLDDSLLNQENDTMTTAEEALENIKRALMDLPPDEQRSLLEALGELVDGGDVEQWVSGGEGEDGRRGGASSPTISRDRSRGRRAGFGMDSRAQRGFDERTGGASRIVRM
jgi:hypothetical protein